jgi:UTP--glucose-1-phosphate uridylyltransferase
MTKIGFMMMIIAILSHMVNSSAEFVMELTVKTRADIKGGTLIDYKNNIRLLEIAQVPSKHVDDFKSVKKFKYFNTNNLWVSLPAVKRVIQTGELKMEIIVNPKTVSETRENILQLETAAGAAIKHFRGAHGIDVPRSRFLPVKSCSGLFLVQSDMYLLDHGELHISTKREFITVPIIELGDHFKNVDEYLSRFKSPPQILELDHLTVSGDVTFGYDVQLKGTVIIDIPSGSILENKVVSGNLRILDH